MYRKKLPLVHPGEILNKEFLVPLKITKYRLAKELNVPPQRISAIVGGSRAITADTALRLSRYFKMSKEFWLGLQMQYDLELAEDELGKKINREVHPYNRAIA